MDYIERHHIYVVYLKMKVDEGDWHGVCDAANDLRELEATRWGTHDNSGLRNRSDYGQPYHQTSHPSGSSGVGSGTGADLSGLGASFRK